MADVSDKIYAFALVAKGNIIETEAGLLVFDDWAEANEFGLERLGVGGYIVVPCSILIDMPDDDG